MFRLIFVLIFWMCAFNSQASLRTPLPLGYAALIYDINRPNGPTSHGTNDPGQWIGDINTFNNGALAKNKITRLHPYSSDIEISCPDPNSIASCSILPGYQSGNASAAAYASAFPEAKIMPIVDIAPNYLNNILLSTNVEMADRVADDLSAQLCSDPVVAGVFFDLEISGGLTNKGLFEFYRKMSAKLASSSCISSSYPNGKYMAMYLSVKTDDWEKLQAIFASNNNSYIAIPLYDDTAFTNPPTPDPLNIYTNFVTKTLTSADTLSKKYKVPFEIIVPAGASFGTFQSYGVYDASAPPPTYFKLIKDFSQSNATQLNFVQAARNASCAQSNYLFMGMNYWSYNQYIYNVSFLNMPNTMDSPTIAYLQQYATCKN